MYKELFGPPMLQGDLESFGILNTCDISKKDNFQNDTLSSSRLTIVFQLNFLQMFPLVEVHAKVTSWNFGIANLKLKD